MEKVKQIEISNFKSIKHLKIDGCNTINIFVGMPNAGKSNILEALSLDCIVEKQIKFELFNEFVRHSQMNELFFEGNLGSEFIVKFNETTITGSRIIDTLHIEYKENNDLQAKMINYSYSDKKRTSGRVMITSKIKPYFYDSKVQYKNSSYFSNKKLNLLNYPRGENLADIISSNPKLRNEVNTIFKENNLKLLIDKSSNELKIFKEYQDGTVFTLPYNMIADTLQRLIFYKAAIMSNENAVLLFEEPEAHCFEPYILEFTNAIKYDKNDNQYFIVTHSDYIIQEFLRDEESKQNTNIYLVNNVDGETQVKLLDKAKNDDVYEYGMNLFFNFESLWDNN